MLLCLGLNTEEKEDEAIILIVRLLSTSLAVHFVIHQHVHLIKFLRNVHFVMTMNDVDGIHK